MVDVKLAWLSPRWPFPADDGAKVASFAALEALAEAGHEIALVAFQRPEQEAGVPFPQVKEVGRISLYKESGLARTGRVLSNLFGSLPVSAVPFASASLGWEPFRAALGGDPAALVVDGLHAVAALPPRCPWPLIYRAHNVEASLWEQSAERASFPKSLYFSLQARRMHRLEARACQESRAVAAISEEDARELSARYPGSRAVCVPVGFRFEAPAPAPPGPLTLGWLGRMDWPPNREGLAWFLREVWPAARAQRPEAKLLLAGSGDDAWIEDPGPGVEKLGRVDEQASFYARIHAAIAPIPYGSGTKIKVIEAARFGRPVFATPEAFRGSGLPAEAAALVAAPAGEWMKAIGAAEPAELAARGLLALARARELFGARAAAEKLVSLLR